MSMTFRTILPSKKAADNSPRPKTAGLHNILLYHPKKRSQYRFTKKLNSVPANRPAFTFTGASARPSLQTSPPPIPH